MEKRKQDFDIFNYRIEEYKFLRNEMTINKKYIFERPLIIITLFGLLISQLEADIIYYHSILIFFYLILGYNHIFTYYRFINNHKILSYLIIVHENTKNKWIGISRSNVLYFEKYKDKIASSVKIDSRHKYFTLIKNIFMNFSTSLSMYLICFMLIYHYIYTKHNCEHYLWIPIAAIIMFIAFVFVLIPIFWPYPNEKEIAGVFESRWKEVLNIAES